MQSLLVVCIRVSRARIEMKVMHESHVGNVVGVETGHATSRSYTSDVLERFDYQQNELDSVLFVNKARGERDCQTLWFFVKVDLFYSFKLILNIDEMFYCKSVQERLNISNDNFGTTAHLNSHDCDVRKPRKEWEMHAKYWQQDHDCSSQTSYFWRYFVELN